MPSYDDVLVLWMLVIGTMCVVLWRRVPTVTRPQMIVASVAFVAGIGMAAPPGPTHLWDYIGMTMAVVALTFLMEVLKRRGMPRIL